MNRRIANMILGILAFLWILLSLSLLLVVLFRGDPLQDSLKYIIQFVLSLFFSIRVGSHIWRHNIKQ